MPPTAPHSARPPRRSRSRRAEPHRDIAPTAAANLAPIPNPAASTAETSAADTEPAADFSQLGIAPDLVRALEAMGIVRPFAVQAASLPHSLSGRDVLARGRTGSGKTVAFALPIVTRLAANPTPARRRPRALVLVPTRELATQVAATFEPLAATVGLRVTTIFGGVSQVRQERVLANGVDIVIACPGRLEDLLGQRLCSLDDVEITVLDEADHLSDLGFLPAVRRLLDRTPAGGQRMLFSATLDNAVDAIVQRYLHDPVRCSVDPATALPARIDHHVLTVGVTDKAAIVAELASGEGPTLLFTRTKYAARKLARKLAKDGIAAVELHGDLAQNARDRNMAAFRDGQATVLVATDIAARGIHVDGIALVVHVDPPAEHKAFAHRSGRTARAGSDGTVVTIATADQRSDIDKLVRLAGIRPTVTVVSATHPLLAELRGPKAPVLDQPFEPAALRPSGHAASASPPAPSDRRGPGRSGPRRRHR